MSTACLSTSSPQFDEPERTPPFLIAASADPDIREFLVVVDADTRRDFNANVMSEDRGAPIQIALYIDYGLSNPAGHPYKIAISDFQDVPPGTLADGPRPVRSQWFPEVNPVSPGCHTITMMVSHEFDFRRCPKRLSDSSQLVWRILRCSSEDLCPPIDLANDCPSAGENPLLSCPETSQDADAGDGGSP
jgi:hypothetical protein